MALTKEEIFNKLSVATVDTITIESTVIIRDGDILIASNSFSRVIRPYDLVEGVVVEVDVSGEDDIVQKVAAKLWIKSVKDSVKAELDALVAL